MRLIRKSKVELSLPEIFAALRTSLPSAIATAAAAAGVVVVGCLRIDRPSRCQRRVEVPVDGEGSGDDRHDDDDHHHDVHSRSEIKGLAIIYETKAC